MALRQVGTEEAAIAGTVLDYFEGWFDGDATRMERALHPALSKRALQGDQESLEETTARWMIDATGRGSANPGTLATVVSRWRSWTCTAGSQTQLFAQPSTTNTSSSCGHKTAGRSSTRCGSGRSA